METTDGITEEDDMPGMAEDETTDEEEEDEEEGM